MGLEDACERISLKATDCPRISTEFLEEELACMGEVWFAQRAKDKATTIWYSPWRWLAGGLGR